MAGTFSFREWYQRNGDALNEKRRQRYHSDAAYRESVLRNNQNSRANRKAGKASLEHDELPLPKNGPRYKAIEREVDGKIETLYSIGAVAAQLGCSIQALRAWERRKLIPQPSLRTGNNGKSGDRLYTQQLVDQIRESLTAQGRLPIGESRRDRGTSRPVSRFIRLADGTVQEVQLHLIGALARAVDRTVLALEQLEAKGTLPETPFRSTRVQRRMYTTEMIAAVKRAFERAEESTSREVSIRDDILAQWTAQNVMGAVLVEAVPEEVTADEEEDRAVS